MKNFLIFIGGFVAGILATILFGYFISVANNPSDDDNLGLTEFSKKGDCLTTTSKNKSSEIDIFQVLEPNKALGNVKYYSEKKFSDGDSYRDYDVRNDVVVLLINYDGKTFYDAQKIEVSNKCLRQIGTYQYTTKNDIGKTVPAVVIE